MGRAGGREHDGQVFSDKARHPKAKGFPPAVKLSKFKHLFFILGHNLGPVLIFRDFNRPNANKHTRRNVYFLTYLIFIYRLKHIKPWRWTIGYSYTAA